MNCIVHKKNRLLFINIISVHLKDGTIDRASLFKCLICDQLFISTRYLDDGLIRRFKDGNTVINKHAILKNYKIESQSKEVYFICSTGMNRNVLDVYVHTNTTKLRVCTRCNSSTRRLLVVCSSNLKTIHIEAKQCRGCMVVYVDENSYLNNKECFYICNGRKIESTKQIVCKPSVN